MLERIKIARKAIARPRRVIAGVVAAMLGWVVLLPVVTALVGRFTPPLAWVGFGGFVAIIAGTLVYLNLSGHVVIGRDGLYVDRRDDRRHIPFDDVDEVALHVERTGGKTFVGARLSLRDGERFVVPIGEDHFGGSERADQLVERIGAALEAYRRGAAVDGGEALRRGGRDARAWLQRLRKLESGANANAREAPIATDRLWRMLESPRVPPETRAGAAAALAGALDDDGKRRLRVVLDDTAHPRLRVAFETALEGDDDALAEALDELEAQRG